MSWSTVTTGTGGGTIAATSTAATVGAAISVGDLIVVSLSRGAVSGDAGTDTCADSLGNTYTSPAAAHVFDNTDLQQVQWFYSVATVAGTPTITVTHPSHANRGLVVTVHRASAGTVSLDVAGTMQITTTAGAGGQNVTCLSVTPTSDNDLLLAFMGNTSVGATTFTAGTGFTVDAQTGLAGSYNAIENKALGAGTSGVAQSATGSDPTSGAKVANGAALFKAVVSSVPTNSAVPVISGTQKVASVLTSTAGTWTGTPTSYAYTWQRADDAGFTTNVVTVRGPISTAATTDTYTVATTDDGKYLRCQVVATNGSGNSAAANSLATAQITYPAPTNTVLPVISGTAQVGYTLSVNTGTWTPA